MKANSFDGGLWLVLYVFGGMAFKIFWNEGIIMYMMGFLLGTIITAHITSKNKDNQKQK